MKIFTNVTKGIRFRQKEYLQALEDIDALRAEDLPRDEEEIKSLAGQLVVWSTLVSAVTIFIVTFLLRLGGAF